MKDDHVKRHSHQRQYIFTSRRRFLVRHFVGTLAVGLCPLERLALSRLVAALKPTLSGIEADWVKSKWRLAVPAVLVAEAAASTIHHVDSDVRAQ